MLQQLEQCTVRKAVKVTEVNCTGSRAGGNGRERRGEPRPWEALGFFKPQRASILLNYE